MLRLLGPLEAEVAGRPIDVGGRKPRALLALLALSVGRVVSVDRLVEDLWPGTPPETSSHAVQVYVSQLRKSFGSTIAHQGPGYVLELEPDHVDVHHFARLVREGHEELRADRPAVAADLLREALALWRGPVLADFEYEPFAQAEIATLDELRFAALEDRIDADLMLGRHGELVTEIEALVEAQPLRERPRALLMRALYLGGRQADALAAYRAARETLVGELGLEPGPELRELEAAILRHDDSLLPDEAPSARPAMQFRRLATVLVVDVVDSLAVAEALDAEALGDVQRRYFEAVSAVLSEHGGTVERYGGDTVTAVFGVPVVHEDDALRAVRAALDVRTAIAALSDELTGAHGVALDVRIGLAAGEVVASSTESRHRFVAGDAIGVAGLLVREAEPGGIVVGELVARLVRHAARLEPLRLLDIRTRKAPIRVFRLLDVSPAAATFERRLDARLVSRKQELSRLRKRLRRARESGVVQSVLVVGAPGVGKSRLVDELTRRARGIAVLSGRCLSYGSGITYWPVRDMLEGSRAGVARDAVLAALEAETPPPAAEIALLFRVLCETNAREKPLVVVFDDVQWAEPTLLELVEQLATRGTGPILVVCLAREELLASRPDFLEPTETVERLFLDGLSPEGTAELLEQLDGSILDPEQRAQLVEASEGNPFFVEQLLALTLEGGLVERALPETVQALLAARLDRLGPGERAVLERGAVVGKEFTRDDVVSLLDPAAAPTAESHLDALVEHGFIRAPADAAYAFRHGLLQEAVYRGAPKRLRADLHERFADRLDAAYAHLPDLDEFVGYHLEQAYRLRGELGEEDRRVARLGADAAERLGTAGVAASKRADAPASRALLRRATSIPALPAGSRSELLSELGITLRAAGELEGALEVLDRAIDLAHEARDRKAAARARLERAYVRVTLLSEPGDELLDAASAAMPAFEAAGDDRLVGRALLLTGWYHGGRRDQNLLRQEAAERALEHYRRSNWPVSSAAGEIANALYHGPTPVIAAIDRCETLLSMEALDLNGRANVEVFLGGLAAQTGDFERARALIESATAAYDELGQRIAGSTFSGSVRAEVDLLAGADAAASEGLHRLCQELERMRAFSHRASAAGLLAEALYRLGRLDQAFSWTEAAESDAPSDDVHASVLWMPVRAKILARRGATGGAMVLATDAVELAGGTDALNHHAKAFCDLGDVLEQAGRADDARVALRSALGLYEAKGNVVAAERTRLLLDDEQP